MYNLDRRALDRYITGNYGEDSVPEEVCYFDTPECGGELWECQTCGEWFCQTHWHQTSKGYNVECAGCEYGREQAEDGEHLYSDKFSAGEWR